MIAQGCTVCVNSIQGTLHPSSCPSIDSCTSSCPSSRCNLLDKQYSCHTLAHWCCHIH